MKKTLSQKGFTLIELIVVIAIIAILTAIVTSNFASSKAKARDAERVSDLAQIQLALALYFDKCNAYPGVLDVTAMGYNCTTPFGNYISVIPKDPVTKSSYLYSTNRNVPTQPRATDYVLKATLETNSTVLSDDVDGVNSAVYNISNGCNEASSNYYYCIRPY